jgi:hypothetical protein
MMHKDRITNRKYYPTLYRLAAAVTLVALVSCAWMLILGAGTAAAYANPSKAEIKDKLYNAAVARNIPPEILYGIAYQESGWRQFDSNGNPLIGYDGIGIGMMQISSYWHLYDRERLKYDIDYNIAAGADILMDKWWNTPSIGNDALSCYEHWFYATWAYNGWVAHNSYPYTVWAHIANNPMGWWTGVPVTPVPESWLVNGYGVQINTPQPAHWWTPPNKTYFSWYDGVNGSNSLRVAGPASRHGTPGQIPGFDVPRYGRWAGDHQFLEESRYQPEGADG